ncbi:MAG: CHAT domain-containing tetratricopeptide repeat protein [Chitinophagaceae bacterium]
MTSYYNKRTKWIAILAILLVTIVLAYRLFWINLKEQATNIPTTQIGPKEKVDLYYYKHAYLTKAHQLNEEKKYDSAIYFYNQASTKFENQQLWDGYVWVNSYIARLYLFISRKNYLEALPYLQKALERGTQKLNANDPFLAATLYYYGLYFYRRKMADSSLVMYDRALKILSKNFEAVNIYTSDVYQAIGKVYFELKFDNEQAEKNYLAAIKMKEALPDSIRTSVLTPGYYELVQFYFLISDYEKAQSYCYAALDYVQTVKNFKSYWIELLQGTLASIYSQQEMDQKAIPQLKNVIEMNVKNSSESSYLAFYYNSLGDIYSRASLYDSALVYYKKVLGATKGVALFGNQDLQIATASYSIGMLYFKLKKYETALVYLNKCLEIRQKAYGDKHQETSVAFQGIGRLYKEQGRLDSALKYFGASVKASAVDFVDSGFYAVPLTTNIHVNFYSFLAITDKAEVLKQLYLQNPSDLKLLRTSFAYYCLADSLMSLFIYRYSQENTKLIFTKSNSNIYEETIDCAAFLYYKTREKKYLDLLFNFIDQRKSTLLLEARNKGDIFNHSGVSVTDQTKYKSLQQELTYLESRLEEENSPGKQDDTKLRFLLARTKNTEERISAFDDTLYKNYGYSPGNSRLKDSTTVTSLTEFSSYHNSIILEYFWGEKAVYILGIYRDKMELLKIENKELGIQVDSLQLNLVNGYVIDNKNIDFIAFQQHSYFVYKELVAPMLELLDPYNGKDAPAIIIIPDGPLSYIPFESLITSPVIEKEVDYRTLDYLLNKYAISYDYSARLLLKNYKHQSSGRSSEVLALSFSKDDTQKNSSGSLNLLRNYSMADLPGSARELKGISFYMTGKFYLGEDATENIFKREAPKYDILHLAVHGQASSSNSYSSRLIFKNGKDSSDDGSLYPYEIYNIPMKARLAVLSACESGVGKLNIGEGMYSIARGFAYAGCPSITMSLWKVNDNSTAKVMTDFYKELSAGEKVNSAIRQSKLNYLRNADRRSAHPVNWAAFVAMGNMNTVVQEKTGIETPVYVLIVFVALILSAYLIIKLRHNQSA